MACWPTAGKTQHTIAAKEVTARRIGGRADERTCLGSIYIQFDAMRQRNAQRSFRKNRRQTGLPADFRKRRRKSMAVSKPGDRRDCQRISGKRRRKSMAVSSVPGIRL